jgi:glycosyltransferase involved in cell wall biosynthesis
MRPKVLVLTKLFWPEGGGGELATYLIIRDIFSKHFDVTIISGTRNPEPDILKHTRYVHWSTLEARYKPVELIKTFTGIDRIRSLVKEADIVYIPSHTLIPLTIAVKTINPRAKIVLHLHNYQLLTYTSIILAGKEPDVATDIIVELGEHKSLLRAMLAGFGHYINYINRFAALLADKIIYVSRRQCEIISRRIPEIRGKTEVIYNPPSLLPILNKRIGGEPILIYVSGDSYVKGFQVLLQALNKLGKRGVKARFIFTNKYSSRNLQILKQLSEKHRNLDIQVLGRMEYNKLTELHRNTWALLFPSIWEEPLPYTIVESMLIGTMPIAARIGGVPEIVRGSPAEEYLFMPGNINELVDKVDDLLSLSREGIMDAGMKLREHALELFNREEIEDKITACLTS